MMYHAIIMKIANIYGAMYQALGLCMDYLTTLIEPSE